MRQARRQLGPRGGSVRASAGIAGERRRQQLDGDQAIELHLVREIHDAHAAATELPIDRVASGEGLLEREEHGVGGCVRHVLGGRPAFFDRHRERPCELPKELPHAEPRPAESASRTEPSAGSAAPREKCCWGLAIRQIAPRSDSSPAGGPRPGSARPQQNYSRGAAEPAASASRIEHSAGSAAPREELLVGTAIWWHSPVKRQLPVLRGPALLAPQKVFTGAAEPAGNAWRTAPAGSAAPRENCCGDSAIRPHRALQW